MNGRYVLSLLLLVTASALAGCINDDGALAAQGDHTKAARVEYVGKSFANYALMNARGRAERSPGSIIEASGDVRAASIVCPLYDGTRNALFIAWLKDARGLDRGALTAAAAATVGPEMVAQMTGGQVYDKSGALIAPPNCDLPLLEDGSPVIVLRVQWGDGTLQPMTREETRAQACPDGYAGAMVQSRTVNFTANGSMEVGEWRTADMGGCAEASTVTATTTDATPAADWTTTRETEIEVALESAAPDKCEKATIAHSRGGRVVSEKTIDTCAAVNLAARAELPDFDGFHMRPVQVVTLPPEEPECPPASITLPTFSTREEYYAALAPYAAKLPLPEGCSQTVTATAHWPFFQTFIVTDLRTGGGGKRYLATREYRIALSLRWHADGGDEAYSGSHQMPWIGRVAPAPVSSLASYPDAFKTNCGECLLLANLHSSLGGTATTYRFNGNVHPYFVGPHTVQWSDTRFPYFYFNPGAAPIGNTEDQLKYQWATSNLSPNANFDSRGYGPLGF